MLYNKRIGIVVSCFINNEKTFKVFVDCIESLIKNSTIIDKIFIVDDGSKYEPLFNYYKSLKNVLVYKNQNNKGIASVKNISLKLLERYNIKILSDCDNIFKKGWDIFYCENFIREDIHNINNCNVFKREKPEKIIVKNKIVIEGYKSFHGNLIIIDDEIVNNVGGFPKLPNPYGSEHYNFQVRINKYLNRENYAYDFLGSENYIENIYINNSFTTVINKKLMSIKNSEVSDKILSSDIIFIPIDDNV